MLKHFPILAKKYRNPEVTQKNRANICKRLTNKVLVERLTNKVLVV